MKTAKTILKTLGKDTAAALSVEDASKASGAFDKDPFNGDGVLVAAAIEDEALKTTFADVLTCTATPDKDKSGEAGATEATVVAFFKEVGAHAEWLEQGKTEAIVCWDATEAAYTAHEAVRAKIADYFARVKVAAYDARALLAVNGEEKTYLELAAKDLTRPRPKWRSSPWRRSWWTRGCRSRRASTPLERAHGHVPECGCGAAGGQEGCPQRGRLRQHRGQARGAQGLVVREGGRPRGEARRCTRERARAIRN